MLAGLGAVQAFSCSARTWEAWLACVSLHCDCGDPVQAQHGQRPLCWSDPQVGQTDKADETSSGWLLGLEQGSGWNRAYPGTASAAALPCRWQSLRQAADCASGCAGGLSGSAEKRGLLWLDTVLWARLLILPSGAYNKWHISRTCRRDTKVVLSNGDSIE